MKTIVYFILFFPFFLTKSNAQESNENLIEANIEIEQTENSITLLPTIQNRSALFFEYNYLFLVKKTDNKNNLSINKQNGKFTLQPGEIKKLSITQLNQSEYQNIKATLYIRDEVHNELITKDSIEIKGIATKVVEETSLMLEGLVVDESKTKFGKDFYDEFYSVYNQYPKKFNFIILISELPHRGQTSIIQVKADQETIHEFFSNPNEEYFKQQVGITLRNLTKYAEEKENLKQEFNY